MGRGGDTGSGRTKWLIGAAVAAPFVKAAANGVRVNLRAARARNSGEVYEPGVPPPEPSAAFAGAVALDELIRMPMGLMTSFTSPSTYQRASEELDEAVAHYDRLGWLDDPTSRFATPGPPSGVDRGAPVDGEQPGTVYFDSAWEPRADEPGRDRWQTFTANRRVPVRLLTHADDRARPWLVAVHGQGMGRDRDIDFLRMRHVHERTGVNVALPVLPLHGERMAGWRPHQQFVTNTWVVNNVLGLTQAVWDVRRLLAWIRTDQQAPAVGLYGLSLGSYVAALVSTLEAELACVIAVVPTGDIASALRDSEPLLPPLRRAHRQLHDDRSMLVHRVVSPLARPCVVPADRRFILAGQGDRIAPPAGTALLAAHWGEDRVRWRARGHLTTGRDREDLDHIADAMRSSGLVATG